ncbi:phosphoglycerate mutase family protein, partial [Winkia sp. UMB10116]|uniref:phosphoglycerate mutase family protein n=1 Tax=Winkia sp. UMB10116 TaxID=3046355 RepID=UPI0025530C37
LYLMRHGETEFNLENRVQGWCDSPLTEKGIRQAELARDMLREREITFTHGYCSPLDRARETLKYSSPNPMPTETVTG